MKNNLLLEQLRFPGITKPPFPGITKPPFPGITKPPVPGMTKPPVPGTTNPPVPGTTNPPVATEQNPGGGGKQYRIPGDPWRWTIGADGGWWAKRDTDTVWRNVSKGAETTNPNWKKSVDAMDKAFFGGDSNARKSAKNQTGEPLPEFVQRERAETIDDIKSGKKYVYRGSKGDIVTKIQEMLNKVSSTYGYDKIDVDSKFGLDTYNAVRSFQEKIGNLRVDGIVGKNTIEALEKSVSGIPQSETQKPETPVSGQEPILPSDEVKPNELENPSEDSEIAFTLRGTITELNPTEGDGTISDVLIIIKGTDVGTSTNSNGNYELRIPKNIANKNPILIVTKKGFNTQEIEIGDDEVIDVQMEKKSSSDNQKPKIERKRPIKRFIDRLKQKYKKKTTLAEIFEN